MAGVADAGVAERGLAHELAVVEPDRGLRVVCRAGQGAALRERRDDGDDEQEHHREVVGGALHLASGWSAIKTRRIGRGRNPLVVIAR